MDYYGTAEFFLDTYFGTNTANVDGDNLLKAGVEVYMIQTLPPPHN
jgi:hypothetical protein